MHGVFLSTKTFHKHKVCGIFQHFFHAFHITLFFVKNTIYTFSSIKSTTAVAASVPQLSTTVYLRINAFLLCALLYLFPPWSRCHQSLDHRACLWWSICWPHLPHLLPSEGARTAVPLSQHEMAITASKDANCFYLRTLPELHFPSLCLRMNEPFHERNSFSFPTSRPAWERKLLAQLVRLLIMAPFSDSSNVAFAQCQPFFLPETH